MIKRIDPPKGDGFDKLHIGVKAVLNLIPVAGGTATEIFNAIILPPFEIRLSQWRELVADTLKKLEEQVEGTVPNLARNTEFTSLLISASTIASKTHLTEKHEHLRNGLVNSIDSSLSYDFKEVYMNFIDETTIQHVKLLEFLDYHKELVAPFKSYKSIYKLLVEGSRGVPILQHMDLTAFRYLMKDLEGKGLIFISDAIEEVKGAVYEASTRLLETGDKPDLPFVKITTFGKGFLDFITEPEKMRR